MTFAVIIAGVGMPGPQTAQGAIVLPNGLLCSGGDPVWFSDEQTHRGLFDVHPEFRPFGIDAFWSRAPIYATVPLAQAPDLALSGTATDPRTYASAVPLNMGPQVPTSVASY